MRNIKYLNHENLKRTNGGFVPVVIFGVTYSAKAVAGYFGAVTAASSGITLAVINNNSDDNSK
ncbi:hypothetical protein [Rhodohalobacter sp. SW132]|uniref:hypothetical protein n=1 Tax=Rhodohalobacter sp. SW132 TaxID=2293433 RepID=UPI0011C06916|nr:hypothetical protein [Rhodohalobacter sp. SW132]